MGLVSCASKTNVIEIGLCCCFFMGYPIEMKSRVFASKTNESKIGKSSFLYVYFISNIDNKSNSCLS
ncbi:hypothetical protein L6452_21451 [Arctium lappa]|uniref:Uncharacterized protein n=1 Tax=Arctium lappa TaxID=4217 RepID=A0ACB9AXQ7_ARCLA|nr:hypothetical protein L6452_21451 [Arctium lappa]